MAHCSHGRAHALQQGQAHARPAAGGAAEGVPAPGARVVRGRPCSSRLRREAGERGVEGDGKQEEEQGAAAEGAAAEGAGPRPARRPETRRRGRSRCRLWRLERLCVRAARRRCRLRGLLRRPRSCRLGRRRLRLRRLRRLWRRGGGGGDRWGRRVGGGSGSGRGRGASGRRRVGGRGEMLEVGIARRVRREPRRYLARARARRLLEEWPKRAESPSCEARQGRPVRQRPQGGQAGAVRLSTSSLTSASASAVSEARRAAATSACSTSMSPVEAAR